MESFAAEFDKILSISEKIAGTQPKYFKPIQQYRKVFGSPKIPINVHYDYCREIYDLLSKHIKDFSCKNHDLLTREDLVIVFNKEKGSGKARVEITDLYSRAVERSIHFGRDVETPVEYLYQVLYTLSLIKADPILEQRLAEIKTTLDEIKQKAAMPSGDLNQIMESMISSMSQNPNLQGLAPMLNTAKTIISSPMAQQVIGRIVPVLQQTGNDVGSQAGGALSDSLPTILEEFSKFQDGKTNIMDALNHVCKTPKIRSIIDSLAPLAKETAGIAKDFGMDIKDLEDLGSRPLSDILLETNEESAQQADQIGRQMFNTEMVKSMTNQFNQMMNQRAGPSMLEEISMLAEIKNGSELSKSL